MAIEVKVPLLPESISDATVSTWHKKAGDEIKRDENIVDLETDKVMLEVPAPTDGVLKEILKPNGSVVQAQEIIALIEPKTSDQPDKSSKSDTKTASQPKAQQAEPSKNNASESKSDSPQTKESSLGPAARRRAAGHEENTSEKRDRKEPQENIGNEIGGGQRAMSKTPPTISMPVGARPEKRVAMTRIRARIAERLLEVKQNTAMLTTFNEINMAQVMDLRQRYKEKFEKKYKARLGFMSFFVKASVEALKRFPVVNSSLDGNDIVYHGYFDVGVAVSTDRGLVVPILRDADKMSMAEIETTIAESAEKARLGKLTMEEMQGGTFTITNGGVFGSLMATPILNSPQCAILGMHKIQERPVVENGQIVIRPMMYVALSYDHRLIDGKESVSFLVAIKEALEDPTRVLLEV